ncbi:hypothetical protein VTN31DRAFT_5856 [Thermomyces dupontii]|uniref:uncharacterized protein n=1 Tax=Talaromyces thermophilus TaxID=28565 RepID=UPI0037449CB9
MDRWMAAFGGSYVSPPFSIVVDPRTDLCAILSFHEIHGFVMLQLLGSLLFVQPILSAPTVSRERTPGKLSDFPGFFNRDRGGTKAGIWSGTLLSGQTGQSFQLQITTKFSANWASEQIRQCVLPRLRVMMQLYNTSRHPIASGDDSFDFPDYSRPCRPRGPRHTSRCPTPRGIGGRTLSRR